MLLGLGGVRIDSITVDDLDSAQKVDEIGHLVRVRVRVRGKYAGGK